MEESINELLALVSGLIERVECLESAKADQDEINSLLTEQIVGLDNSLRYARDEISQLRNQFRPRVGGIDYCNPKLAAIMARGAE